uniref:OXY1 n=1 Tax=Phialomyces arenicola TaxID=168477 RepID=A0A6H0XBQ6_9EURO|nr:OXY1 [Phialomyces arenicola]
MASISYAGLLHGTAEAVQSLTEAALTQGFFELDLDCSEGTSLQEDVRFLESFSEEIFDSPAPVKALYDFKKIGRFRTTGFKPLGSEEGAKPGKPDGFEMFMLPQNELLLSIFRDNLKCPPLVMSKRDILTHCMRNYEKASQTIVLRLTEGLGLGNELLEAHEPDQPSVTNLGFLKYPPQPKDSRNFGHIAHTDVGSLTILSSTARGLQVIDNDTQDWVFVESGPQHIFVQFGDCLKFLSQGRIIPSIHRVVPSDVDTSATKYTIAYFVRPNEKAQIATDDGTTEKRI